MCPGRRQVFLPFSCAALLFGAFAFSAQDKPASSKDLKIGFLMDSLKVERWQTDLDNFQKRAGELGAQVLVETAEGDDELQLQQAQKLLSAGVKSLVLVSHDAEKAVRIVTAAKTRVEFVASSWSIPLNCHWYVKGSLPVTATLKLTVEPSITVWLSGWATMNGGALDGRMPA